jgi:hypothetical protein
LEELEEGYIPTSKAHVTGKALERLDIGVCSFNSGQLMESKAGRPGSTEA